MGWGGGGIKHAWEEYDLHNHHCLLYSSAPLSPPQGRDYSFPKGCSLLLSLSLLQIAEGVEDEAVLGDSKEIDLVVRASAGEGEDTDPILNTDGRASGGDATGRPARRGRRTSMYRRVG